jgi:hypothetical protein
MQDRIDPLIERMRQWIGGKRKVNSAVFPSYCKDVSDCLGGNDGISMVRKTGWIFNAYEQPKNCGCTMKGWEWE